MSLLSMNIDNIRGQNLSKYKSYSHRSRNGRSSVSWGGVRMRW